MKLDTRLVCGRKPSLVDIKGTNTHLPLRSSKRNKPILLGDASETKHNPADATNTCEVPFTE